MAKISTSGIDDFDRKFGRIEKAMQREAIEAILKAGAQPYVEQWKSSIASHGHVKNRNMIDSVAMTDIKVSTSGSSVAIYPQGTDDRGVSNALKAYVIHYGYGGHKTERTGDKFVTQAERDAQQRSVEAMQAELDKYIDL